MSKSLGNSFLPNELFSGNHKLLEKGYSPMTVRFFMLQSHYSSTLDFSNEALNVRRLPSGSLLNSTRGKSNSFLMFASSVNSGSMNILWPTVPCAQRDEGMLASVSDYHST